ncbi:MAG: glycosyltransferase family 4 protein [Chloroflexia bacterium]|nr:glycosyltransferase family 4 protein [Chloroflexia bacterium]
MLITLIATGTFSFFLTYLVRHFALQKSILDIPNDRSSHTIPTPRGGGLAVAISWFVGLVYFFLTGKIENTLFYALIAGIPLTLIGFADDVFSLKPIVRFLVQFICAALALWFLGGLHAIDYGPWTMDYNIWLLTPLALIAIIWAINFFNFLDGIDGYIGSEIVFIGLAAFSLTNDLVGLLLAAATFGFLLWNWPKAKIFMGDVGSTLLGFTVAVMAIYHQNNNISSVWVWLILTSVFWFDATVTLFRRFINKEKLSEAHRKHAYQRAVQSGYSHQQVTVGSIVLNFIGFGFAWLAFHYSYYAIIFLIIDLAMLFMILRFIDKKKPFDYNKILENN